LERDERNFLRVLHCKANDRSDLVVINTVDQRSDKNDVNTGFVQIVDRTKLYIEQVADLAVRVSVVTDTVELQIKETKSGIGRLTAELFRFSELDTVGRGLHRVVADFACIEDRFDKVRA